MLSILFTFWAHRVLVNSREQRMLKMMAIADDTHFSYDDETELVQLDLILAQIRTFRNLRITDHIKS